MFLLLLLLFQLLMYVDVDVIFFAESISWLVFSVLCLIFLVNSSQRCTSEVYKMKIPKFRFVLNQFFTQQCVRLVANVVRYSSSSSESTSLFQNKQDILTQIRDLPLQIVAAALFNVDRNQMAAVSVYYVQGDRMK